MRGHSLLPKTLLEQTTDAFRSSRCVLRAQAHEVLLRTATLRTSYLSRLRSELG